MRHVKDWGGWTEEAWRFYRRASTPVVLVDRKGVIRDCNLPFSLLLGHREVAETRGLLLEDLVEPDAAGLYHRRRTHPNHGARLRIPGKNREHATFSLYVHQELKLSSGSMASVLIAKQDPAVRSAWAPAPSGNEERVHLLREINHRVRNNIQIVQSLLAMEASDTDTEESRNALERTRARVHAIGMIQDYVYEQDDLRAIDLAVLANEIAYHALAGRPLRARVQSENAEQEIRFPVSLAMPAGMSLNEAILTIAGCAQESSSAAGISLQLFQSDDVTVEIVCALESAEHGRLRLPDHLFDHELKFLEILKTKLSGMFDYHWTSESLTLQLRT